MISSFESYLKRHYSGISLVTRYEFEKLCEVIKCKQKDLKKARTWQQVGNDEIELLYKSRWLGIFSPFSADQYSVDE